MNGLERVSLDLIAPFFIYLLVLEVSYLRKRVDKLERLIQGLHSKVEVDELNRRLNNIRQDQARPRSFRLALRLMYSFTVL